MTSPRLRLLIHIGASSRLADDVRYREQARAILGFQGRRVELTEANPQPDLQVERQLRASNHDETTIVEYLEDSQDAFTALESQLLLGSFDDTEQNTSIIDESSYTQQELPTLQPLLPDMPPVTPARPELPYSSYLVSPSIDYRATAHLFRSSSEQAVRTSDLSSEVVIRDSPKRRRIQSSKSAPVLPYLRADLPVNPHGTDVFGADGGRSAHGGPTQSFVSRVVRSDDVVTDSARETSSELTAQPHITEQIVPVQSATDSSTVVTTSSNKDTPLVDNVKASLPRQQIVEVIPVSSASMSEAEQVLLSTLSSLSTTFRAPEPETGFEPVTSFLTKHLNFLEGHAVGQAYTPIFVTREIRPFERGYWTLDSSTLPLDRQISFWQYLEKAITSGVAGWGVWGSRTPLETHRGIGEFRVFCWGEIVKHIYLLLYVASHSKVRRLGLQWLDAEDKVVVQMQGPL